MSFEDFETILHHTKAYEEDAAGIDHLWSICGAKIFSHDPSELRLGLPPSGVTSYYSQNITQEDIKIVQECARISPLTRRYCASQGMECYNNRLFKHADGHLELRMASSERRPSTHVDFKGVPLEVSSGDYACILEKVNAYLELAKQHAMNDVEKQYLEEYQRCFREGRDLLFASFLGQLAHHIKGSALWTQDQKPSVENYIGFIENYRDPYGVRGEWEGFVAIMNKKYTQILTDLVEHAPAILRLLPWDPAFEKVGSVSFSHVQPVFLKPDFTSIDIVGFFGSGIPAGINIPNYDDVRQNQGFKNVSLGNIINARRSAKEKIDFVCEEDQSLMHRGNEAFSVQVGLHELLGHGSGALFTEGAIPAGAVNPFTQEAIQHGYKEGETWSSVFNALANTYEECRAECVGLYLCSCACADLRLATFPEVLRIFGYDGAAGEEMMYLNWLHQLHMSLVSLQAYNVTHGVWTQSHCCARHVYLQVLLRNTSGLVWIEPSYDSDGNMTDFVIRVDRTKIVSEGRRAIGDFLQHLQVFKSCADFESGSKYFEQFTNVDETFLKYRAIVMDRKKPRAVFMQPNLELRVDAALIA